MERMRKKIGMVEGEGWCLGSIFFCFFACVCVGGGFLFSRVFVCSYLTGSVLLSFGGNFLLLFVLDREGKGRGACMYVVCEKGGCLV